MDSSQSSMVSSVRGALTNIPNRSHSSIKGIDFSTSYSIGSGSGTDVTSKASNDDLVHTQNSFLFKAADRIMIYS